MKVINIQRSVDENHVSEVVHPVVRTKMFARKNAIERQNKGDSAFWSMFVRLLFAWRTHCISSFEAFLGASEGLNQRKFITLNNRMLEESAKSDAGETAPMVVRPALLELAIESVPAIDLENKQQLVNSLLEIVHRSEVALVDSSQGKQPTVQTEETLKVMIINAPNAFDAQSIAKLFRASNIT